MLLYNTVHIRITCLGRLKGSVHYAALTKPVSSSGIEAQAVPGVTILQLEGSFFFANANKV